jgi:hypothetical protein
LADGLSAVGERRDGLQLWERVEMDWSCGREKRWTGAVGESRDELELCERVEMDWSSVKRQELSCMQVQPAHTRRWHGGGRVMPYG